MCSIIVLTLHVLLGQMRCREWSESFPELLHCRKDPLHTVALGRWLDTRSMIEITQSFIVPWTEPEDGTIQVPRNRSLFFRIFWFVTKFWFFFWNFHQIIWRLELFWNRKGSKTVWPMARRFFCSEGNRDCRADGLFYVSEECSGRITPTDVHKVNL